MRNIFIRILIIFFMLCSGGIYGQICKESLGNGGKQSSENKTEFAEHTGPEFAYDVTYYRTFWEINPNIFFIKGWVTTYFKPISTTLNQIGFDMNFDLTVDSVTYHNAKLAYTKDPTHELLVNFPKAINKGTADSITVYYHGIPYSPQNGIALTYHNNIPEIWTLSEPYGARDWWPCKQSLDDKADSIDIYVKTIRGNRAASNGLLVSSIKEDTMITYHWKHRYPIAAYLVGIAVTNFAEYSIYAHTGPKPGDSLLILNYVYPEDSSAWYAPSLYSIKIMELYVKLFGRYPFDLEKYGQAEFDFGGGQEHQTMSFMNSVGFSLMAHEMGHQWFGDKVTCGSWKDIWLNEGFATYLEGLAEKYIAGADQWKNWLDYNIGSAYGQNFGSVSVSDTTSVSRIFDHTLTYAKGGMVLRMLHYLMGDSAFFKGLRAYLNDKDLAYDYANTADLQRHCEEASGLKLDSFFKEWVYGQGYPQFNIYWKQYKNDLKITIVQKPVNPSVRLFHIPVPVFARSGGKDTVFNLFADSLVQDFNIYIPDKVDSIAPDPERWLLAKYAVFAQDSLPGNPIDIYPNPATNTITLNLHDNQIGNTGNIIIYDAIGRDVMEIPGVNTSVISINISNIAKGFYILKYKNGGKVLQEKFMKML